jgi:hypothetical protein
MLSDQVQTSTLKAQGQSDLADLVTKALDDNRLILLVDGLDEWTSKDAAEAAVTLLQSFVELRRIPVLLASRPHGLRLMHGLDARWRKSELAGLTRDQQTSLATKWFEHWTPVTTASFRPARPRAKESEFAATRATNLIQEISAHGAGVAQLAEIPLLLSSLIALSAAGRTLPQSRFRAYQDLTALLLEHHPQARGRAAFGSSTIAGDLAIRETAFQGLAYTIHEAKDGSGSDDAMQTSAARLWIKAWLEQQLELPPHEATSRAAAFQRSRTAIPIDCGQAIQLIADSIPTIADRSSRRRLHGFT